MKNRNKIKIAIILGIMCCFLTAGICVQIRTVKSSTTTVGRTQAENELRDSVLRWKEKYENANKKLEDREEKLEELRNSVVNSTDSSSDLTSRLQEYNALLGYTEVKGPGIIITLQDGDSSVLGGLATQYIVHDEDLYQVVNALKNVGAEAISINGQRITSRTAIACVGNVITVNEQKLGSPFIIQAIGPSLYLYSSLKMPGGYLEYLEGYGVKVDVKQVDKDTIVIPKYDGVYTTVYATNVEG